MCVSEYVCMCEQSPGSHRFEFDPRQLRASNHTDSSVFFRILKLITDEKLKVWTIDARHPKKI